jgi:hypothetical protein
MPIKKRIVEVPSILLQFKKIAHLNLTFSKISNEQQNHINNTPKNKTS